MNNNNNILRNKKGLSLLEVIAVVIISGILLAFGAISISNIIGSAEGAAEKNDATLIVQSCEFWFSTEGSGETYCTLADVQDNLDSSFITKYDDEQTVVVADGDGTYTITLVDIDGYTKYYDATPREEL